MSAINANGYAGDIAQFYTMPGVTGDNTYYAYADDAAYNSGAAAAPSAGMYGTGYANTANGFSTNVGYSNHAGDVAYFYGSTGSDTFYADADFGQAACIRQACSAATPAARARSTMPMRPAASPRTSATRCSTRAIRPILRGRGRRHLLRLRLSHQRQQRGSPRPACSAATAAGTPIRPPASPSTSAIMRQRQREPRSGPHRRPSSDRHRHGLFLRLAGQRRLLCLRRFRRLRQQQR